VGTLCRVHVTVRDEDVVEMRPERPPGRIVVQADRRAQRCAIALPAGVAVHDPRHVVGDPDEVVVDQREPDEQHVPGEHQRLDDAGQSALF
jgi:hypothetical protein